jgi:hypothetical protein
MQIQDVLDLVFLRKLELLQILLFHLLGCGEVTSLRQPLYRIRQPPVLVPSIFELRILR